MRRSITLFILLAVLVGCERQRPKTLYTLGEAAAADDEDETALISTAETRIDPEVLVPGEPVKIDFHVPDTTIVLELEPVSAESLALPKGQYAWVAQLPDGNEAFFMRIGDLIEAQVRLGDTIYRLRSKTPKTGVLEIFDGRRFREAPKDGIIDPKVTGEDEGTAGDSSCEDPAERVDVMVLYTPAARDAAGGVTQIENEIAFAVARTNVAYVNSSVTHRLNLIYTGVATYTEASAGVDSNALLGDLADESDGVLDTIHGLRDAARGDLVSLIYEVDDDSWCGWGQTQQTANADTTDHRAFTVVQRSCAGSNLSFAHEIGHNMGALHDRDNASNSTHDYNFGHIQPVPSTTGVNPWRSVMSYNSPCKDSASTGSCPRVPWFSNPNVMRLGDATGVPLTEPEPEHNVMVLALNDGEVSRYRCLRSGAAANVWMKDLWEDGGGEPDPATAGQPMWKSPYIWVRRSEDTNLEFEHQHEDPQQGQTNHIYVKLHNTGGTSESSNLELYFASASTNLNDPASWTLIDSKARTIGPGVDIAKFEWSGIPGSGHYCLLARWNIDGTALAFTSVGDAVRADNDLIWRNVNVIPLAGSPDKSAVFEMAGDRQSNETYLLITTEPMSHRKIAWAQLVRASIEVDPAVLNRNRLRVLGLRQVDRGEFELPLGKEAKLLGPFVLRPRQKTRVTLTTIADSAAVKQASAQLANPAHYDITVAQIRPEGIELLENPSALFETQGLVIGGVSYTLRVPASR